ncbi:uncharacterized protein LOC112457345 [Temnothorax curvispinosus]|uniref:Uncharacterized protein LOC112457345 n=1 Tax=Temnothorax curvispinosus TaxID=300111 RepID=A0A6J1Q369_9HYME|nr:uncharacterized protein LOC112457345 [Temnothorax curvispinosus]
MFSHCAPGEDRPGPHRIRSFTAADSTFRGTRGSSPRRVPPCRFVATVSSRSSAWMRVARPSRAPRGTTAASSASIVALSKVTPFTQRILDDPAKYCVEEYLQIPSLRERSANVACRTAS